MRVSKKSILMITVGLFAGTMHAESVDVKNELTQLLQDHALIVQAEQGLIAAQQQLKSTDASWYPTFSLSGNYGREHFYRDPGNDNRLSTAEFDARLRQTLWDFGKTSSTISKAQKNVSIKEAEHTLQSQNVLLAGLEAYVNLKKDYRVVRYAQRSEENIKTQTKLENTRINKGRGYTSDVLQAKSQLAGARAKRVSAEQALSASKNRYIAVFGVAAPNDSDMPMLSLPHALLPNNIDELIDGLALNNPSIRLEMARVEEARAERRRVKNIEWMPSLSLVASTSHKENQDGVSGDQDSNQIAVQFDWDINLAGQSSHQIKAAAADEAVRQSQADYMVITEREAAKNAWTDWALAKERAGYLLDQAEIADQYLSLVRKERELGRRSLIDVLSGETSLINAQSDYSAAQASVIIASYNILRSMGKLTLANLDKTVIY
ncbi:TolC family protein [Marinomonas transparens]|uniref:TolC family protein n=1 Tax=Marinomonas transparens TaxID=2795388 RepID=A0A934JTU2_9GAMM|nr:TolC family protein [Marinomonas transparens]MBJ7539823.1 TolC family protein [Marinomonas transparens]